MLEFKKLLYIFGAPKRPAPIDMSVVVSPKYANTATTAGISEGVPRPRR